jgi:hypothetical protein
MLYSASRDDLKRSLGLSFFACDYSADTKAEVSYEALVAAATRQKTVQPLTELEKVRTCWRGPFAWV